MHEKWLTNSRDAKKREQSRARRHVHLLSHAASLSLSQVAEMLRYI
jgi:hypothetical protein